MDYTAKQISEITGAKLLGNAETKIRHIIYDTRIVYSTEDMAFIAIDTEKNKGTQYLSEAVEKGIKSVISTKKMENTKSGVTQILIEDSMEFLRKLAKYHLDHSKNFSTVGITGSNGKTIIKEWLYQSLHEDYNLVKSPKSFNSQLGLPLSLLQIEKENNLGIFEVGISKPKEMETQEKIFSPQFGILPHIGTAHLSNFRDEEELIDEKLKLFSNSETILFNGDHDKVYDRLHELYPDKILLSYGFKERNSLRVMGKKGEKCEKLQLNFLGRKEEFIFKYKDEATLYNTLCIITFLLYKNYPANKIQEKVNALRSVEMRLESVKGNKGNIIINDSYNLDIDSLIIAFQYIKEYKRKKKILVLTDFSEHKDAKALYEKVAKIINEQAFEKVFLLGEEITNYIDKLTCGTEAFKNREDLLSSKSFNAIENSLILLKGARKFEIERVKNYLELQKHDTVMEINLNAILHNINVFRSFIKPGTKIMAMVKAFSYGLGDYEIAEFLQHHHVDYLGVAYTDEGRNLRKKGITLPIMVMNPEPYSFGSIIEYSLEPEIYSFRLFDIFCRELIDKGYSGKYPVHIKVETGMHRLGFKDKDVQELLKKIKNSPVKVVSIFSHLSSADAVGEEEYTLSQIELFSNITRALCKGLGYRPMLHILNSSGILNFHNYQHDMVRIGIGMIGEISDPGVKQKLIGAVKFKTIISQISELEKGETVGYGRKYKTKKKTKIATVSVGYADGIPRSIGNGRGKMGINDKKVPIVGNICMDMAMLDIGDMNVQEGDEVTIFNPNPSLQEFSKYCKTIPYEVLTSVSRRVKRIYIKS
ncbi:MAG: bifunctional UDP-N-acetylmuramoyl-tripeptide:D-alanyl-D-alanine ligase/alanine racemase [Bergeyella sp.]|nr:bifunctional UDP-N-acetylmuramoyl-tripeptide:D-alanyl-D-alanine ligase/alanine racemase [Bergeyella sp.]